MYEFYDTNFFQKVVTGNGQFRYVRRDEDATQISD